MFFKRMFPVVGRGGTYLISGIGLAGLTAATAGSTEDGPDTKSKFIGDLLHEIKYKYLELLKQTISKDASRSRISTEW